MTSPVRPMRIDAALSAAGAELAAGLRAGDRFDPQELERLLVEEIRYTMRGLGTRLVETETGGWEVVDA